MELTAVFIHYTMFLVFLGLAIYTIYQNHHAALNRAVFCLLFFFSVWAFGMTFIHNPYISKKTANVFVSFPTIATLGYGISVFFSLGFYTKKLKYKKLLYVVFALYSIIFISFQISGNFSYITTNNNPFGFWEIEYHNKTFLHIANILDNIYTLAGFYMLFIFLRETRHPLRKKQAQVIFMTGFLTLILGSANVYIPQLLNIYIPWFIDACSLIFALGLVYSIIRLEIYEITPSVVANQIIDMLPVGLILTDNHRKIIRVNSALLDIAGRKKSDFINLKLDDVISNLILHKSDLHKKDSFNSHLRIKISDSKQKSVFWYTSKVKNNLDYDIGTISIVNDIDQLARTESQLKQLNVSLEEKIRARTSELQIAKEKAEESNRLKTAFLNNISHEFRTPMNGIIGFSKLIAKTGLPDTKREEYAHHIRNSCERLIDIVTDTVEISQVQSNQAVVNISPVNLDKILAELTNYARQKAERKGLRFLTKMGCHHQDLIIQTDHHKLLRSIKHLLDNAIKFTHQGTIELTCEKSGDRKISISIRDTGIGISPDMQNIVSEPFYQARTGLSDHHGGSGLGLSLVKAYAEMLGGILHLESEENSGTKVSITLPAGKKEYANGKQDSHKNGKYDWPDKTILVAEDEEMNYVYLEEILSETQAKILYAKNGQEAVDFCRNNAKIDLILMDIKMPVLNGYQATQLIKDFRSDIPVIAQTAYALEKDIEVIRTGGFDDYLTKPLTQDKLFMMMAKYL